MCGGGPINNTAFFLLCGKKLKHTHTHTQDSPEQPLTAKNTENDTRFKLTNTAEDAEAGRLTDDEREGECGKHLSAMT